jgi:hypothetical protein
MALPATRRESQLMGEMRDRVVDTAQQVAGDVAQRVQHVAEEIKPELEETARKAVGVKQTGKEAAGEIKQTFQHGAEAAKEETNKVLANEQSSSAQTMEGFERPR